MKAKELQSLPYDAITSWTVGCLAAVEGLSGTSIRRVVRITDGRGGTVYIGEKKLATNEDREVAYDSQGNLRGGDDWTRNHARPINKNEAKEIRNTNRAKRIASNLYKYHWYGVDKEKLLKIHEMLVGLGINVLEEKPTTR